MQKGHDSPILMALAFLSNFVRGSIIDSGTLPLIYCLVVAQTVWKIDFLYQWEKERGERKQEEERKSF